MIEDLSLEEWAAFDAAHRAPTFFARPAWTIALCDASPRLTPSPFRIRSGGRTWIFPAVRSQSRFGMRDVLAFPMGAYTCVLDEQGDPADAASAALAISEIARVADRMRCTYWPLGPQPDYRGKRSAIHETAVIDCAGGFDSAISGIRGVTRRMAGQSQRRGVIVRSAGDCSAAVRPYYAILQDACAGWGIERPSISEQLLQAVVDRGGLDVEIWFAEVDGKRIAGGVVLYGRDELFFWSAAMRRDHSQYRPSNALNLRLIQAACDRGVRWYNLGASIGLGGVARFKSDLGAISQSYGEYTTRNAKFEVYSRVLKTLRSVGAR